MTVDSRLQRLALRRLIRGNLGFLTCSALALGAISAPAMAQDAAAKEAANAEEVGEVVVTGIRRQLETSQARKQEATELVDAITADDIGALPDRSVTEVLQRIPGLAIGRVPSPRDADRIAIEGSGVTIRGLSWVRSELNGHTAFSAKNSRTLGFEDIPPELLAGVDVYKNPSAQQVEGGLSGSVNLRTRLPFDSEGRKLSFSLEGARGDLAEEWEPSGSALISGRSTLSAGNTDLGEIGGLVSVSSSDLTSRTDTIHIEKYYARTDLVPGQTVYATGGIGWRQLHGRSQSHGRVGRVAVAFAERERRSLSAVFLLQRDVRAGRERGLEPAGRWTQRHRPDV